MNTRETDILAEKTISADGTETIDLDIADIISRLDITYRYTAATHTMSAPAYKCLSKIEIVDGSDVLFSLEGGQAQALNIYDRGVPTMSHGQHVNSLTEFQTYGIDFGRWLWDEVLAFDATKFSNPQLKVTIDMDAGSAGVTSGYLRVRGNLFDEKKVTPTGFLMSKEHYSYTPASSGAYEYVELPQDYTIKRMMVQPYLTDYEPWYVISEVKLDENNEGKIPFDVEVEDYVRRRKGVDPAVEEALDVRGVTGGYTFYTTPTSYYANVSLPVAQNVTAYLDGVPRAGKLVIKSSSGTCNITGTVRGELPNHCINFPFGDQNAIGDWYDTTKLSKARLRLKSSSGYSGSDVAVVLQQYRPY